MSTAEYNPLKEVLEVRVARCIAEVSKYEGSGRIFCPNCIKSYERRADYAQHALAQHQVPLFVTTIGSFTCGTCSHKFATRSTAASHFKVKHTKEYPCGHCDHKGLSKVDLVTHMHDSHRGVPFAYVSVLSV